MVVPLRQWLDGVKYGLYCKDAIAPVGFIEAAEIRSVRQHGQSMSASRLCNMNSLRSLEQHVGAEKMLLSNVASTTSVKCTPR